MRTMYKTIEKDERLRGKQLYNFINNPEYHWLVSKKRSEGLYAYRADIYHTASKMCHSGIRATFTPPNLEVKLMLKIPEELLGLKKQKEGIEIEDFVELLWVDYKKYILDLFKIVTLDYSKKR